MFHRVSPSTILMVFLAFESGSVCGQPTASPLTPQESENPAAADAPLEVATTTSVSGMSLEQIMNLAVQRNPELAVQRAQLGESWIKIFAAGLLPNPDVMLGRKKVEGDSDTGPMVQVQQELPINGALGLERQSAHLEYQAERLRLMRDTQVILSSVKEAYVDVLGAQALDAIEQRAVRTAEDSLKAISERYQAGLESQMPQSLAQADLATARIGTIQSSRELVRARQNLARKIAMDETQLPAVAGDLRATFLPADLDPSHYRRPDLDAWSMQGQAAQTDVAAAQRSRIPNPVISYSREEAGHEIEHMFQVGIEVPILNNKVPAVRQKAAAYDTVRAQRSATANEVDLEREQAFQRLAETQEALRTYDQEAAPAIRLSLSAAKSAFQSGTSNLTLLLQTQSRLIEMERGQMRAVVALRKAELETLLALGTPR